MLQVSWYGVCCKCHGMVYTKKSFEDNDLAQMFALNFQNLSSDDKISEESKENRPKIIISFLENIKRNTAQNEELSVDIRLINEPLKKKELIFVIKNANLKSSSGSDEIPFLFYYHSPDCVLNYILNLINTSWATTTIPTTWKTSISKPILKPNKNSADINSYRPISITNTIRAILKVTHGT